MATAFHYFPHLPWELRARVWELFPYKAVFSITPIPAMLQACRESRNLGVYRHCFSDMELQRTPEFVSKASSMRYIWSNLDLDIIDIGPRDLRDLKLVTQTTKRLKLERHSFVLDDAIALSELHSLEEVHIVCKTERVLQRCGCILMLFYHGHLDTKRIILIDKANKQTTTLFEWNREAEERFEPHREEFQAGYEDYTNLSSDEIESRRSWAHIYYAM